jgi:hypothetical protein
MTESHEQRKHLDPAVDPSRWERAVDSIMTAAAPELRRRASQRGTVEVLEGWARPIFALAASVVLVASASLLRDATGPVAQTETDESLGTGAEAVMGAELAAWIEAGYSLSADELVTAIDEM